MKTIKNVSLPIELRPALFVGIVAFFATLTLQSQTFHDTEIKLQSDLQAAVEAETNTRILEQWRRALPLKKNELEMSIRLVETSDSSLKAIKKIISKLKAENPQTHILLADVSGEDTPQSFAQMEELFASNPEIKNLPKADQDQLKAALREYRYNGETIVETHNRKLTYIKFFINGIPFAFLSHLGRDLPVAAHALVGLWMGLLCAFNQYTLLGFNRLAFAIPDAIFNGLDKAQDITYRYVFRNFFQLDKTFEVLGLKIPFESFAVDLASRNLDSHTFLKTIPKKLMTFLLVFPYLYANYFVFEWGDNMILHHFKPQEYGLFDLHSITNATLASWMSILLASKTDYFAEGIPHLAVNNFAHRMNRPLSERLVWITSVSMFISSVVTMLAGGADLFHAQQITHLAWPISAAGMAYYVLDQFLLSPNLKENFKKTLKIGPRDPFKSPILDLDATEKQNVSKKKLPTYTKRSLCITLLQKGTQ